MRQRGSGGAAPTGQTAGGEGGSHGTRRVGAAFSAVSLAAELLCQPVAAGAPAAARVWRQFDFQEGQYFSYELSVYKGQRGGAIPAEIELVSQDDREWAAWIRTGKAGSEQDVTVLLPRNPPGPLLEGGWAREADKKELTALLKRAAPETTSETGTVSGQRECSTFLIRAESS